MADLHNGARGGGAGNKIECLHGIGGERLLNQDGNLALNSANYQSGVEARRRGDDCRLEAGMVQQLCSINVGGRGRGNKQCRLACCINRVTDRHDLGVGECGENSEMVAPHDAEADQANLHAGHALPPWRSTARRSEAATSSCSAAVIAANIGSERQPFANASVTGSTTSSSRSLMYGCWLTGIG